MRDALSVHVRERRADLLKQERGLGLVHALAVAAPLHVAVERATTAVLHDCMRLMRSLVRLDEVGNMFMRARLQHLQAVELHLDRVDRRGGAPALGTRQEGLDRDDVFALAVLRADNRRKRALRNRSDAIDQQISAIDQKISAMDNPRDQRSANDTCAIGEIV